MYRAVFHLHHFCLLGLVAEQDSILLGQTYPTANHKPTVEIILPPDKSTYKVGTSFRYQITVSDPEDGQSSYQEIPGNQVFMDVLYLRSPVSESASKDRITWLQNPALVTMKKNQCFTCHRLQSASMGPSFSEIRHRYKNMASAADAVAQRIKNGSRGIWGEAIMPALEEVSLVQTRAMAGWILEQSGNEDSELMLGLEGSIAINPPKKLNQGIILLTASYLDNGYGAKNHASMEGVGQILIQFKE